MLHGFFLSMVGCSMLRLLDITFPGKPLPWPAYVAFMIIGIAGFVTISSKG